MKKAEPPRFSGYLDEREQQMNDDYEWCLHDPKVRKKYGGKVVIAYKRRIWGVGKNHREAWAAAEVKRGCPRRGFAAMVVVPYYIPDADTPCEPGPACPGYACVNDDAPEPPSDPIAVIGGPLPYPSWHSVPPGISGTGGPGLLVSRQHRAADHPLIQASDLVERYPTFVY